MTFLVKIKKRGASGKLKRTFYAIDCENFYTAYEIALNDLKEDEELLSIEELE